MADRHSMYHASRHQMTSRVGTGAFPRAPRGAATNTSGSTGSGTSAPSASTSVRRNLFQSQLTRRPTQVTSTSASNAASSNASNSNDGLRASVLGGLDGLDGSDAGLESALASASDPASRGPVEIVVRDRNGELELVDPPSPTADEMAETALDARQESESRSRKREDCIYRV